MNLFRKKYRQYTDEALIGLLSKGSEPAFDELYHRYADRMQSYFYRLLYQDAELASDFCQNLFLKIFEKANAFNDSYKFSTWMYTIASNMVKNEYRRQSSSTSETFQKTISLKLEPQAPKNLDKEIFQRNLQNALNQLEEKHRLCFTLRYQEEKSVKEISTILACPAGTVKSRIHYALKKLSVELYQLNPNPKKQQQ